MATTRTKSKTLGARSSSNVIADTTQSLQTFDLLDLKGYTLEKSYASNASRERVAVRRGRLRSATRPLRQERRRGLLSDRHRLHARSGLFCA